MTVPTDNITKNDAAVLPDSATENAAGVPVADMSVKGRIHSFQSLGAVDGPGLRFVVFVQGCPMRCMYCHNPDTWNAGGGTEYTVGEVVSKVLRYRPYFGKEGGVTVSGGEALMQAAFVTELFRALKAEGIHTCLDTSGIMHAGTSADCSGEVHSTDVEPLISGLLAVTDLVICDIKFTTEKDYLAYAGGSLSTVLSFLSLTEAAGVPLWVRHVVVPGFTDSEAEVKTMIDLARRHLNLSRIELLPFRKLCVTKYESLGVPFRSADVPECDEATVKRLSSLIPENLR